MKLRQVMPSPWQYGFDWDGWCNKWINHNILPVNKCPADRCMDLVDRLSDMTGAIEAESNES